MKNYKALLAPSYELAKDIKAEATVEAEYGDNVVEGSIATLAHHGPRRANPAPCNTKVSVLPDGSTILVSHIDLDAVGGVMALAGIKPEDEGFWKAAAFIDVSGPQYAWTLDQAEQDKLNAVWAWRKRQPRSPRLEEVTDVTATIEAWAQALTTLLGEDTPEKAAMFEDGRRWVEDTKRDVEACLVQENENVRVFKTRDDGGPFCCGSYDSETLKVRAKACVQLNPHKNAITLSFYDMGEKFSALEIMQNVYGPLAGGSAGIAGTPRGNDAPKLYTLKDALDLAEHVDTIIKKGE